MKKIIPVFIVVFVFGFVITAGVLIVKTALSSDTSNAKLIEAYIDAPVSNSTSMITFTHLADAESEMTAEPATPVTINAGYLANLPLMTASAATITMATSSATSTVIAEQDAAASPTGASSTTTDQPSQDIATAQQLSQ